jgi:alkanesulfonate monooxygenase SsuD/methylene tetrahydromethanopterin reductase-like flavin-dependent oxidoreductase (luciferase family)
VALARATPGFSAPSNVALEESRPRFEEAIEIRLRAWTQDAFSFEGKYYKIKNLSIVPKPIPKPHPKIYTGGTSDVTYQMAGQRGWGIFVPPLLPYSVLEGPLEIYKKAYAESGHELDIVYIRPVYLDYDESQIRKDATRRNAGFSAIGEVDAPARQATAAKPRAGTEARPYRLVKFDRCIYIPSHA